MLDDLDLTTITDPALRQVVQHMLNVIEQQAATIQTLRADIQRLKDENARLKGEQGKPAIKPSGAAKNYSSERERREPTQRGPRKKRTITIDREETCTLNPNLLPADAVFVGYAEVTIQDLILRTDNILFRCERWESASQQTSYVAPLPPGYHGDFGPSINALALTLAHETLISQPKLLDLFALGGVSVSAGTLASWLLDREGRFAADHDALYEAGLRASPAQGIDDTGTRVNGQNQHCHIVCNPLMTSYHTCTHKDRLTVIDVLRNGRPRAFLVNAEALDLMAQLGVSATQRARIAPLVLTDPTPLDAAAFAVVLEIHLPGLGSQQRQRVREAAAIAAYRAQTDWPVVQLLVGDDAGQWKQITAELALCWVHDGRHYTKLEPVIAAHRRTLTRFRERYWRYYHTLRAYQRAPTPARRRRLERRFDQLFTTLTGYAALDDRIAKTRAHKHELLQVLAHPEIPLHNNAAELAARQRVRKRDVSFGPRTAAGATAWDTFQSIVATARKLGVNVNTFGKTMYGRILLLGYSTRPSLK